MPAPHRDLQRELNLPDAVLLGLGSILGTGIFVSVGIAADVAGSSVVLAIALAALVATCNGLSSAQLAASHPRSGGTYEYGYRYLSPSLGFTAGWMFVCAKSASAATAALGFAGYFLHAVGMQWPITLVAVVGILLIGAVVLSGIRRSAMANALIVSFTLLALVAFVLLGLPDAARRAAENFADFPGDWTHPASTGRDLLHATALMFVAYTGYGRIATLGEEVTDARRTIPRAIIVTLVISMLLYVSVAGVAIAVAGAEQLAAATKGEASPLARIAEGLRYPFVRWLLDIAAITAMLGVLLNLILGLSRVLLAMGRRGDMPAVLAKLDASGRTPWPATLVVLAIIVGLSLIGSVKVTWSFSAFTVLIYYAITNAAALRLGEDERLYPKWIAVCGLAACLGLAFWVEPMIWAAGLGVIAVGLLWHLMARRLGSRAL